MQMPIVVYRPGFVVTLSDPPIPSCVVGCGCFDESLYFLGDGARDDDGDDHKMIKCST